MEAIPNDGHKYGNDGFRGPTKARNHELRVILAFVPEYNGDIGE